MAEQTQQTVANLDEEVALVPEDAVDEQAAEAFGAELEKKISALQQQFEGKSDEQQEKLLTEFEQQLEQESVAQLNQAMSAALSPAAGDEDELFGTAAAEELEVVQIGDRRIELSQADLELWLAGHLRIEELEDVSPQEVELLAMTGHTAYNAGQIEEAIDIFQIVRALDRKNPNYHVTLGAFLMRDGGLEEAIECFDEALELRPNDLYALVNRAEARYGTGDIEGAREDAEAVTKEDPNGTSEPGVKARSVLTQIKLAYEEAKSMDKPDSGA